MRPQSKAYLFGFTTVLFWSTSATAFKLTLAYLEPMQLVFWASLFSWMFLFSVLVFQGRFSDFFKQSCRGLRYSLVFGLLNPVLYYFLLFQAYDLLPAQEAQAINYTWAIVMSLLAVPLLKSRLRLRDIIAAIMCYSGVLIIATKGNVLSLQFDNPTGLMLALASTVVWSFYWIFNQRDRREPVLGLCLNFSFALPLLIIYTIVTEQLSWPSWQGIVGSAYIGVFEMGAAFVFWLVAMKNAENVSKIANLIFLSPLLSIFLISSILGEQILHSTLLALLLILSGLAIQQLGSKAGDNSS
jgi:drug/metabolite transporter (DMT)-like permease